MRTDLIGGLLGAAGHNLARGARTAWRSSSRVASTCRRPRPGRAERPAAGSPGCARRRSPSRTGSPPS